ncbi:MAG: hypothetical protein EAZ73_11300 [Oscillatoriales cyanobacterium]|nr:MAG: hypothetical protein EAZ83_09505 [Oscillatoriales cyanobacterium]TAF20719.1 MAG: hypothetical protein EAZ73_11300 [Oscillatoriales cyanobacterium]
MVTIGGKETGFFSESVGDSERLSEKTRFLTRSCAAEKPGFLPSLWVKTKDFRKKTRFLIPPLNQITNTQLTEAL